MGKRSVAAALGIAVMMVGTSSASAAVEVGNDCVGATPAGGTSVQIERATPSALPLTVPSAGIVTSWKVRSGYEGANLSQKLKVFRSGTKPNQFTAVGESKPEAVTLGTNTFETQIPVQAGDRFGVFGGPPLPTGAILLCETANVGDKFGILGADPAVGSTTEFPMGANYLVAVSAVVEPDADGDGFGDETQDRCPSQATTQGACDTTAPGVKDLGVKAGKVSYDLSEAATVRFALAKKLPGRKLGAKCVRPTRKNRSHKRCPRLRAIGQGFDGTGNAGGNQVAIPGWKKLTPGTYLLTMTARDVAGNQSSKTTTFTIPKKKKKKK